MIDVKELRRLWDEFGTEIGYTPEHFNKLEALSFELLNALEAAEKELEETRIKIRKGEEFGLGPYTLVPNEMFERMVKALGAADVLASKAKQALVATNQFNLIVLDAAVEEYNAAREGP